MSHTVIDSPIGRLTLVGADGVLTGLYLPGHTPAPDPSILGDRSDGILPDVVAQLGEYFNHARTTFDVAMSQRGTAFQLAVWEQLRAIPYGETRTYGEIAAALGRPGASRAVGIANGRNPISIIVPCHRVIGAAGKLTGYAGGVQRKAFLLDLERRASLVDGDRLPIGTHHMPK